MHKTRPLSCLSVEALGTFWLVIIGCGAAIANGTFLAQSLTTERSGWVGIAGSGDDMRKAELDASVRPVLDR